MRAAAAGLAMLLLGACVGTPQGVACSDPELRRFLGQPLPVLVESLRLQEGDYKVDIPLPHGPTLEEFPDRLRVSVDEAGVILGIGCG